ncbi:MAG: heparinase II/III family protein [Pirellulales bacterium]
MARFLNPRGETVEIAAFENAQGKRFYLDAAIDTHRSEELLRQVAALAKLYAVTKNEECSRRVARVLARYADVFPHYLVKEFRTIVDPPGAREQQRSWYEFVSTGGPWLVNGKPRGRKPSEPEASQRQTTTPYGWTQSRWGWGRWNGEMPLQLLHAYDLTYDAAAWSELSDELGKDARRHVEQGLFREAASYLMEYPFYYHIHNNAGTQIAELVRAGMVLDEPKFVDFGRRRGRSVLEQYAFSRDGAFGESPGYFYVFLATHADNYVALREAAEYFGGSDDASKQASADVRKATEFLDRSQAAIESVRLPNGSSLPVSDNRHDEFADPTYRPGVRGTPRKSSADVVLPGYGHVMLGAGSADRQVQAHLHFSPFKEAIHTHRDGLSLMLWAFGCELYTDIGYNRTKYRQYASTTLSHNTVVVDRSPQNGETTKGRLLAYEHDPRGWSFVQVEDSHAYGLPVTRYRRSLLLNTRDLAAPYLVDVFEVRGGRIHDYALHGPTVFDSTAEMDLPLAPMAGERPLLQPDEAAAFRVDQHPYGQFTNVRAATPQDSFAVTYRLEKPYELPQFTKNARYPHGTSFQYVVDPQAYADRAEIGVCSRFVGVDSRPGESWQVLLGETPSLLRGGLIGSALTEKLKRPSLLLRHEGASNLSTTYVVVHEPYYRTPKITAVRRLKTREPGRWLWILNRPAASIRCCSTSKETSPPSARRRRRRSVVG